MKRVETTIRVEVDFGKAGTGTSRILLLMVSERTKTLLITSGVSGVDMISLEEWKRLGNTSISIPILTHMGALGVNSSSLLALLSEMAQTLLRYIENLWTP